MKEKIKALYIKNKEFVLYAVFGIFTTVANAGTFLICSRIDEFYLEGNHHILSNILAWFAGVLVAFITNKIWVFESKSWKFKVLGKEVFEFLAARILSFVFENVGLEFCVRQFSLEGDKWRQLAVKLVLSVVVVTTNYVFSKFIIFKKKKTKKEKSKN